MNEPDPAQTPWYQRFLRVAGFAAAGVVLLGQLLDSVSNTIQLITPVRAIIGTVVVVGGAVIAQIRLRKDPLPWRIRGGSTVRLRGLGPQHTAAVFGIVVLLWTGLLFKREPGAHSQTTIDVLAPRSAAMPLAGDTPAHTTHAAPAEPELVSFVLNSEESYYSTEEAPFDPQDGLTEDEFRAHKAEWREMAFGGFQGPIARRTKEGAVTDFALARAAGIGSDDPYENEEYFGTGDSATTARVAAADSTTREALRSKLSPVYDLTVINRGETTTVLFALVVHTTWYKDGWGADWPLGEVAPTVLNVLNRYPIRVAEVVDDEGDVDVPDTIQTVPPIELPPNRALRIQVQLFPNEFLEHIAFVGRLCFLFHGARPVCTSEFATLL